MTADSAVLSPAKSKAHRAILWGGLIAGTLDITAAFINSGLRGGSPVRVLQGIASGLLGADSYNGGLKTAALGLGIHFLIATTATVVYYVASRKLRFMVQSAIVSGLLYGIVVYLSMYGIVLPLTFHRNFFTPLPVVVTGLVIHMLCVGLPIALVVRWRSK